MEWVETTGKSVEEAKEAALDQLGVDEADAEVEVVDEVKSGLFGLRRSEARVRARVKPTAPRAKEQHTRRKRRSDRDRPEKERAPKSARVEAADSEAPAPSSERRPRKPKGEGSSNNTVRESGQRGARASTNEGGSSVEEHVALADQAETAKAFLLGFLEQVELAATVDVDLNETDELINISVDAGGNAAVGHLIGPRGTTLQALQELTRTVVQRKTGARNGRILVDISQYREKRRVALERFTRQIAEEVLASGTTKTLEPMHPSDRKVVHDTVNTIDGVETASEGEEPRRRVIIKPAESA